MDELKIFPNKNMIRLLLLGAAIFVVIGILMLLWPGLDVEARFIGSLCLAFFGACGVYLVRRIRDPSPAIVIDESGVLDNASAAGAGRVYWAEITEARICSYRGFRFLGIYLNDPATIIKRQTMAKRILMRLNHLLVGTPVNVPENVIPMGLKSLEETINAKLGEYVANAGHNMNATSATDIGND